jgi:hypothetical protein
VAVQRKGLFNSGRAHTLQIHTGDEVFELRDQRGQITAQIGRSVGGVVISHEATTIDHWLQRLRAALEQSARQSVTMAEALSRLL